MIGRLWMCAWDINIWEWMFVKRVERSATSGIITQKHIHYTCTHSTKCFRRTFRFKEIFLATSPLFLKVLITFLFWTIDFRLVLSLRSGCSSTIVQNRLSKKTNNTIGRSEWMLTKFNQLIKVSSDCKVCSTE